MLTDRARGLYFDQDSGGSGGSGGDSGAGASDGNDASGDGAGAGDQTPTVPANFGEFLKAQTPEVRKLYEDDTAGLKAALTSERQQRKDLEVELRDAAKAAEKGSELEKNLLEQADKLQGLEKQAAFYDEAHTEGVSNLRLAWIAAKDSDMFDKRGNVEWDKLKARHPELFVKATVPAGDAGKGTGSPGAAESGTQDMNAYIRAAAGREV